MLDILSYVCFPHSSGALWSLDRYCLTFDTSRIRTLRIIERLTKHPECEADRTLNEYFGRAPDGPVPLLSSSGKCNVLETTRWHSLDHVAISNFMPSSLATIGPLATDFVPP